MPKVWNKHNLNCPKDAVYGGRPGPFGNQFRIGMLYQGRKLTRQDAVAAHKDWFLYSDQGLLLQEEVKKHKGEDWSCWCAPLPCHCNIYLEIANA